MKEEGKIRTAALTRNGRQTGPDVFSHCSSATQPPLLNNFVIMGECFYFSPKHIC